MRTFRRGSGFKRKYKKKYYRKYHMKKRAFKKKRSFRKAQRAEMKQMTLYPDVFTAPNSSISAYYAPLALLTPNTVSSVTVNDVENWTMPINWFYVGSNIPNNLVQMHGPRYTLYPQPPSSLVTVPITVLGSPLENIECQAKWATVKFVAHTQVGGAEGFWEPSAIRMVIVKDKHPTGQIPVWYEGGVLTGNPATTDITDNSVFQDDTILASPSHNTNSRYRILYDRTHYSTSTNCWIRHKHKITFKKKHRFQNQNYDSVTESYTPQVASYNRLLNIPNSTPLQSGGFYIMIKYYSSAVTNTLSATRDIPNDGQFYLKTKYYYQDF